MFPRKTYEVRLPGRQGLQLGERTLVMGILNVTPDSFADGGRFLDPEVAVRAAEELAASEADLIDIGGESTRPGAEPLSGAEEVARVLPVIRRIVSRVQTPLSIDTYKAEVARVALQEGVSIVNDISGLRYDPSLAEVVAAAGAALVLMHTRGRSSDMYREAVYEDVAVEVKRELEDSVARAVAAGVARTQIIVDPGLGFAKRPEHSYEALAALPTLATLDRPILIGPSRKSFLQAAIGQRRPDARLWGSAAAVAAGVFLGAHVVRVHDVPEMVDVVRVADRVRVANGH
ncbi:MAG TPA: dihydropteroate synthase [Vicinamibacterales bacterium]